MLTTILCVVFFAVGFVTGFFVFRNNKTKAEEVATKVDEVVEKVETTTKEVAKKASTGAKKAVKAVKSSK